MPEKFTSLLILMNTRQLFEQMERDISTSEVVVMRHVHGFPVYHRDIISPYLMVFVCHRGMARALYDLREIRFAANELAVVFPNHILHPLESSPDYDVSIIVHSRTFHIDLTRRRPAHDYTKFHSLPSCLLNDDDMMRIVKALEMIEIISNTPISRYPKRHEMLLMQANIMAEMVDDCRKETDLRLRKGNRNGMIFSNFSDLVATHYREQHEVAFYADKLHLTTRHLSVIIKQMLGTSASDFIKQYLAAQAKYLLATRSDLTVMQIAYHLGFSETPSFYRFFKRVTQQTPKEYLEGETTSTQP